LPDNGIIEDVFVADDPPARLPKKDSRPLARRGVRIYGSIFVHGSILLVTG